MGSISVLDQALLDFAIVPWVVFNNLSCTPGPFL
ncbi:hypothetical protein MED193_15752 [Roseobacter sp. MED193]|nr:hypothetical protein MED193_15752 [Roseobacter sp. MED193]